MKRILLVDDEAAALDGLRYRLHRMSSKWHLQWAASGEAALQQMQEQVCDVVITDMRMPGMDGAQLLQIVTERWPQAIRIVLSGYSDQKQIVRLVPFAHQYLSKPCEPKQLENVVDRCLLLHELLQGSALREIVGRIRKLPTLPRIYLALQAMVRDDKASARDVAALISADAAIAARVLQIVNSAFFRLARRITSIEQAVSYLGFTTIRNIATSVEVFTKWEASGVHRLDPAKLQMHANAIAAAGQALTAGSEIADDTILAGLLHDIGYWVLMQECPGELDKAVELANAQGLALHDAEVQIMGASHAEVGAYLLGLWGLPYPVVEAVAHHHQPRRVAQRNFDVLAALSIADSLHTCNDAQAFGISTSGTAVVDEEYLRSVQAPFDWTEALRRVASIATAPEIPT